MTEPQDYRTALAAPFPADVIGWKAQAINGNRALAVAYIDARDVMDRLDDVVGVDNWQDTYTVLADGTVLCRLSIIFEGEWIHKEDVGGESEQKDEGDRRKASFSDALKRAAIKWGIGRYLYRLPLQWVDYDPQKKQLKGTPTLPPWALPKQAARPQTAPPQENPPAAKPAPAKAILKPDPQTGLDFEVWIEQADATALQAGWTAKAGDLTQHVFRRAHQEGWPDSCLEWDAQQVTLAVSWARKYKQNLEAQKGKAKTAEPAKL